MQLLVSLRFSCTTLILFNFTQSKSFNICIYNDAIYIYLYFFKNELIYVCKSIGISLCFCFCLFISIHDYNLIYRSSKKITQYIVNSVTNLLFFFFSIVYNIISFTVCKSVLSIHPSNKLKKWRKREK